MTGQSCMFLWLALINRWGTLELQDGGASQNLPRKTVET